MNIILTKKITNLGDIGDQVSVKNGYARNFLLPKGHGVLATPDNIAKLEAKRSELEAAAKAEVNAALERAKPFDGMRLVVGARVGAEGKLFGSVGTQDVVDACQREGHVLERSEVRLPEGPIRMTGEHEVQFVFHADVEVPVTLSVVDDQSGPGSDE